MSESQFDDPLAYNSDGEELFWPYLDQEHPNYQISRLGNVKLKSGKFAKFRSIKGYCIMRLYGPSGWVDILIHIMIAKTFLSPSLPAQNQINHINGKPDDNRVLNLEWCTPSENCCRRIRSGRQRAVLETTFDGNTIRRWISLAQAVHEIGNEYSLKMKEGCKNLPIKETSKVVNEYYIKKACADPSYTVDGRYFRFEADVVSKSTSIIPPVSAIEPALPFLKLNLTSVPLPKSEFDYRFKTYLPSQTLRPVAQLNLDGTFIRAYRSAIDGSLAVGAVTSMAVLKCLWGTGKTAFKYKWRDATLEECNSLFQEPPPSCEVFGVWKYLVINNIRILVSSHGFVVNGDGRVHLGCLNDAGYYSIGIGHSPYFVHRLIMSAFEPIADNDKYVVDHINRNRSDNHLSNLRWATSQQNAVHALARPVEQLDLNGCLLAKFESITQGTVACGGISLGNIRQVLNGNRSLAYGYKWRYAK